MQRIFVPGTKLYKIVNALRGLPQVHYYNLGINTYEYKDGESFAKNDGMFFTDIENIFAYIKYGPIIVEAETLEDTHIKECNEYMYKGGPIVTSYVADKVNVLNMYPINLDTVKMLIHTGADCKIDNYNLFIWALVNNYEIFDYLTRTYITDQDNITQISKAITKYYGFEWVENNESAV